LSGWVLVSAEVVVDLVISIFIGVGLSAACGFRVFMPMLVMSIAAISGAYAPAEGFAWVGTVPALAAFGIATVVEIAGYYVPWVDNLLDTIALPASVIAGTVCTAAAVTDLGPLMTWSLAFIVGGGSAATIAGVTTVIRGGSTATTGGLANPVVSTGETVTSTVLAVIAIVIPVLAFFIVATMLFFSVRVFLRWRRKRAERRATAGGTAGSR
jgi:large-conductance mechanosensitive channel